MKIKYKIYVIVCLLIAIALSLIYPLKYKMADKTIPPLPAYHSYEEAIMHNLKDSIVSKAQRNKCKKYILPVKKIQGDAMPDVFPPMVEDINIALASYPEWKLQASEQEKADMKARYDTFLDKWGTMINPAELFKTVKTQSDIAFNIKYSAGAKLLKEPHKKSDDLKLIVTVNDERTLNQVFKVEVTFVDPATLETWKKARGQNMAQLALSWVLRDKRVTSVIIGASKVSQIEEAVAIQSKLQFTDEELSSIEDILKS